MKTTRAFIHLALAAALCAAQGARAQQTQKPADTAAADAAAVPAPVPKPAGPPIAPPADTERGLRLNFRGVPLDMVLNYMSEAAGFIIVLDTP
ncbi:MAG TPA: hypothetical protein VNH84_02180, partial [Candidatus Saccharimonadales bacterium]|nr:hypothetical protein [Candidatus Saccharimonadales bacterium]